MQAAAPSPSSDHAAQCTNGSTIRGVEALKNPPPEPRDQIKRRAYLLLSFWSVIIFLGLPIWLWTTTVYRASLPLERMDSWAAGKACSVEYPIHIAIEAPHLDRSDLEILIKVSQQTLDDRDDVSTLHHFRFAAVDQLSRQPDLTVLLQPKPDVLQTQGSLQPYDAVLEVSHPKSLVFDASAVDDLAHSIVDASREAFADEQSRLAHALRRTGYTNVNTRLNASDAEMLNQRSARSLKYASTYHLTFSLFSGSASPQGWDIRPALDKYIMPLLESFEAISTFNIDTQVQYYASLSPSLHGPTFDATRGMWTLEKAALSGFINAAEWPLSPSIGQGPTVNFVLYVPSSKQSPLVIQETLGTSWLIPQWGGVKILNVHNDTTKQQDWLTKDDLDSVVLVFGEQLVSLLGLPSTPASLPLRLSSLTRERATELILSASSTMGALSRLTLKLTSIAIPDNVAVSVDKTLSSLDDACALLREARYEDALHSARLAEQQAEKAFFDPSMVGQVYFPDEHKVAVYVPLLGPMAVPLVMALLKEVKAFIAKRRA